MIETYFKGFTQPFFDKIGRFLMRLGITPNKLTLIAFLSGISAGFCISLNKINAAAIFLIISGLCDVLDGTIARIAHTAQKIGAYMDMISDRLVEASIVLGFAYLHPQTSFALLAFLAAALFQMSTFLVATMVFANSGKKHPFFEQNAISRLEVFMIFFLLLFFQQYIFEVMVALSSLIIISGINRFFRVIAIDREMKLARKKKKISTEL